MSQPSIFRKAAWKLVWTLGTICRGGGEVRTSSKLLAKCAPPGTDIVYEGYLERFAVLINNNRFIDQQVLHTGYEPWMQRVIDACVPTTGAVCMDIGANVGLISLKLAKRAETGGTVYAFEPSPAFFKRLKRNLELNPGLELVIQLFNTGVSERPGTLFWSEDPTQPGNGMLHSEGETPVPVIAIDDFAEEQRLTRLDFVKIDVEGMEQAVLKGGMKTWEKFRPVILFETLPETPRVAGYPVWDEIVREFKALDYELHAIDPHGASYPAPTTALDHNSLLVPLSRR